ncbi:MAG: hypothetical protein JRF71_05530 [Deltaproteobacteria bacterium]|nr:hypothetical protein [Deltaproteobacteria bacterium]
MTIKRLTVMLLAALLIFGCAASAQKMNQLQMGMTKAEVIEAMGPPQSTSSKADIEYLKYRLSSGGAFANDHYVRLREGKVDAFGTVGDFGIGY